MSTPFIGFPQISNPRQNYHGVPLPYVTVDEICDATAAAENVEVIEQDVVQLESDLLRVRRVVVSLEATVLIYQSTNRGVRSRAAFRTGLMGGVAFGPQAKGTINGMLIRPHHILVAAEDTVCEFVVQGGYESVTVGVPPINFGAHLRARRLWHRLQPQRAMNLLDCDEKKARAFFSFGRRLADAAAHHARLFEENKEVRAAAQIELMELFLDAIGSSEGHEVSRPDNTRRAHSHVVQLAEEWALTRNDYPIYVADLCKAAGVSERTLEYAFQEILAMTPVAFLRRLRLHRVRRALRVGTPKTTTVSAEALKWGFWHFGDFSRAYKNCFGETPSHTLRRELRQSQLVSK